MKRTSVLLLIIVVAGTAAGCSDSPSGEFREFQAQEQSSPSEDVARSEDASEGAKPAEQEAAPSVAEESTVSSAPLPAEEPVEAPVPEPAVSQANAEQFAAASTSVNPAVAIRPGDPGTGQPVINDGQPAEPLEIKLLVKDKTFKAEGPERALRVSYDDIDLLKVLNMEPVPVNCVDYFPQWLKDLDGKRIRIRGFMFPPFQETDIPFFVLARDNQICCFGRNPKRYDVIDVAMREGVTTDYIQNRPFDVVGVFHIAPEESGGELYQLYTIDDAVVIDN